MSRLSRQKEKSTNSREHSGDHIDEGTAARTRPLSYEEIMLRRKNKKMTADIGEGAEDPGKLSGKDKRENVSSHSEQDGGYKRGKDSDKITNHVSEDTMKRSSRKKEETASFKEGNLTKDRGKGSRDVEAKLKDRLDKDLWDRSKDSNNVRESHHRGRNKERFRDENEPKKRHSENLAGKEKYRDSERARSERESKRKTVTRDEEKNRHEKDGNSIRKYDSGKYFDSEPAERKSRKKDTSPSNYEGSAQKRRRSRSRETRDRVRKSVSLSPRAHKRTYHEREHGDSSLHSSKDRRQHSDVDRNLISSNGGYASSHRRHSGHGSKLGGYSPRKRRTEAAIKTPSPTARSPEKKSIGWDLPPTGAVVVSAGTMVSNFESSHQTVSKSEYEFSGAAPVTPNVVQPLSEVSMNTVSIEKNVSIDSVQLTQATRPMRTLYVENLPASVSDKSVMECLNKFLSSGANHGQGVQPCISCIMNKEKGQALLEFLTPEYATVALSFDGRSFSGSVVRVRRPKDFVDAATGPPEKSAPTVDAISDIVRDSPHKIFIGGIPKVLSADMFQEIVCAFGVLKAYRFQVNEDLSESCAFLEYVDQSLTLKACAGLNGMKLGGKILTVVQAVPDASIEENRERAPSYGIPEHAKPLLSKPTKVLKLKNVFNTEDLSSISEPDFGETLEDIRLECARFGTVRSVNVVKCKSSCATGPQAFVIADQTDMQALQNPEVEGYTERMVTVEESMNHNSRDSSGLEVPNDADKSPKNVGDAVVGNRNRDPEPEEDLSKNGTSELSQVDISLTPEETLMKNGKSELSTPEVPNSDAHPQGSLTQLDATKDRLSNGADSIKNEDCSMRNNLIGEEELKQDVANGESGESSIQLNDTVERKLDSSEKSQSEQQENNLGDVFEEGCILVEYVRTEASCMAAHCLHGRLYGDRVVAVDYIPYDLYLLRFPK